MFRSAFPDLEIALDEVIAEGETVASRATLRGTHKGDFLGVPATGRSISVPSLTMVRIVEGRLVESRVKNDTALLMAQINGA
jgi:predicted ester cyclase